MPVQAVEQVFQGQPQFSIPLDNQPALEEQLIGVLLSFRQCTECTNGPPDSGFTRTVQHPQAPGPITEGNAWLAAIDFEADSTALEIVEFTFCNGVREKPVEGRFRCQLFQGDGHSLINAVQEWHR